ncbi:MAG: acetate/propionate family kinase [Myxococcota bacterium]|nr:acetate/propionate family kinase [Myxococcota bacterium]
MNILVINCGSSSIKAAIIESANGDRLFKLKVERIGSEQCQLVIGNELPRSLGHQDIFSAIRTVLQTIEAADVSFDAVGHRVVHGGSQFRRSIIIDDDVIKQIEEVSALAPLHNPANLAAIRETMNTFSKSPQVAVFDTAFHATLPKRARSYAISQEIAQKHEIQRYGFHGPSHKWVATQAADFLKEDIRDLRIITCHLGNGASVCAVENGRSIETSMGMTPLEGLVMGTRSGDIDPGVILKLLRSKEMSIEDVDNLLNRESGLLGLSGKTNDMRDIEEAASQGDESCRLAIQVFTHRLRKYIGAFTATMGGVDAIVFTGGIGENSALVRHRVAQRLSFLGARLDEDTNRDCNVSRDAPVAEISEPHSRAKLLVVATDESRSIATETQKIVAGQDQVDGSLTIPVAVSARHIHLTQEAVETLFGEGHELTPYRPLSQPGQFASEEKLTIVGPKRSLENVRVLGPTRPKCQVEVSRTDEFWLGIDAPVRNSGDVANSPGVTLIGPHGRLTLQEGLICARRHIHMTPTDAKRFGVKDKDVVEVKIDSDGRDLIFADVLVRVKSTYALEMHIDTDEANAAEIKPGQIGTLAETDFSAQLRLRSVNYQ